MLYGKKLDSFNVFMSAAAPTTKVSQNLDRKKLSIKNLLKNHQFIQTFFLEINKQLDTTFYE